MSDEEFSQMTLEEKQEWLKEAIINLPEEKVKEVLEKLRELVGDLDG